VGEVKGLGRRSHRQKKKKRKTKKKKQKPNGDPKKFTLTIDRQLIKSLCRCYLEKHKKYTRKKKVGDE